MNRLWTLAATGALLSTGAIGQTTQTAAPAAATTPALATPASPAAVSEESVQQQLTADMQKAGFTDVRVRPDSFLVQAKDKSGTPVAMMIDPNSVTEIVGASGLPAGSGAAGGNFPAIPASNMLSSTVVGTDVHSGANQDIGKIKDVAYSGTSIKAYIVGVGGFLGMGDHYVAVSPSVIDVKYDANAKVWGATMNTTADQLKAAPEFKYPS